MAQALTKNGKHIYVFEHAETMADFAVEKWRELAYLTVAKKDYFAVALSGGNTPIPFLQQLSKQTDLPWHKTHIFLVDERMVPTDDLDSNYRVIKENLLDHIAIDASNVHAINTNAVTVKKAAQRYETELTMFFNLDKNKLPRFDLMFLGIGTDGHTASLFPHDPAASETKWMVTAVKNDRVEHERVTMTMPIINNAKQVIFLVNGSDKADIVQQVLEQQDIHLPATQVNPKQGHLLVLLDEAAAKLLQPEIYQLSFYVPESHLDQVKTSLFTAGAGKLGNYDCVAWQTKGQGQFRPQQGSKPYVGETGKIEQVNEYRVEMLCDAKHLEQVILALKASHPYEEPAYNIVKLENL